MKKKNLGLTDTKNGKINNEMRCMQKGKHCI